MGKPSSKTQSPEIRIAEEACANKGKFQALDQTTALETNIKVQNNSDAINCSLSKSTNSPDHGIDDVESKLQIEEVRECADIISQTDSTSDIIYDNQLSVHEELPNSDTGILLDKNVKLACGSSAVTNNESSAVHDTEHHQKASEAAKSNEDDDPDRGMRLDCGNAQSFSVHIAKKQDDGLDKASGGARPKTTYQQSGRKHSDTVDTLVKTQTFFPSSEVVSSGIKSATSSVDQSVIQPETTEFKTTQTPYSLNRRYTGTDQHGYMVTQSGEVGIGSMRQEIDPTENIHSSHSGIEELTQNGHEYPGNIEDNTTFQVNKSAEKMESKFTDLNAELHVQMKEFEKYSESQNSKTKIFTPPVTTDPRISETESTERDLHDTADGEQETKVQAVTAPIEYNRLSMKTMDPAALTQGKMTRQDENVPEPAIAQAHLSTEALPLPVHKDNNAQLTSLHSISSHPHMDTSELGVKARPAEHVWSNVTSTASHSYDNAFREKTVGNTTKSKSPDHNDIAPFNSVPEKDIKTVMLTDHFTDKPELPKCEKYSGTVISTDSTSEVIVADEKITRNILDPNLSTEAQSKTTLQIADTRRTRNSDDHIAVIGNISTVLEDKQIPKPYGHMICEMGLLTAGTNARHDDIRIDSKHADVNEKGSTDDLMLLDSTVRDTGLESINMDSGDISAQKDKTDSVLDILVQKCYDEFRSNASHKKSANGDVKSDSEKRFIRSRLKNENVPTFDIPSAASQKSFIKSPNTNENRLGTQQTDTDNKLANKKGRETDVRVRMVTRTGTMRHKTISPNNPASVPSKTKKNEEIKIKKQKNRACAGTNLNDLIRKEICSTLLAGGKTHNRTTYTINVTCNNEVDRSTLKSIIERTISDNVDLVEYDTTERRVKATIDFLSKRKMNQALEKLKKIEDFGISCEPSNVITYQERTKLSSDAIADYMKKAQIPLSEHDSKIKTIDKEIQKIRSEMFRLSDLKDFAKLQTLESKVTELKAQRKEFTKYLESLRHRFEALSNKNYVQCCNNLKLEFGLELLKFKTALPMYAKRSTIIDCVQKNQVSVILGETGSGKSTQMTQYLASTDLAQEGLIVCTQPRKVAAISLAKHVCREMGGSVGHKVGYKVGTTGRTSQLTQIVYVTDHTLLNECIADPLLSKYSCIIIDEAHERSIYTDLLLGMIKKALPRRPELRVIITSATIDPEVFISYFDGCPELKVSGRAFPVDVYYEGPNTMSNAEIPSNYLEMAVDKALDIHRKETKGDILVFLTSPLETEKASAMCQRQVSSNELLCLQLHGQLQSEEQQKVFDEARKGQRKVVFATNCAETSITIPGIKYVVDTGLSKEKQFDSRKNMSTLTVCYISQSSADQRKGRAGRIEPGKCYRLYTEDVYDKMRPISTPEILRAHLGQSLLKLMVLGIKDPVQFDYVESPSRGSLLAAKQTLIDLEAIDDNGLTELGEQLAKLALEPRLGKLVLNGIAKGVPMEVVIIAAAAGVGFNVFFRGKTDEQKDKSDKTKIKLSQSRGDIFTALAVFKEWNDVPEKQKNAWCMTNCLNAKSLRITRDAVTEQLRILDKELNIKVKYQPAEEEKINEHLPGIIASCFGENICFFMGHRNIGYMSITDMNVIYPVHPTSTLNSLRSEADWIVYEQILHTSKQFLINVTQLANDEVEEEVRRRGIYFDLDAMKEKRVSGKPVPGLGSFVLRQLIWKTYRTPRKLEECLQSMVGGDFHVSLDLIKDDLVLYTQMSKREELTKFILAEVKTMKDRLRQACHEYDIIDQGHVRALIMHGGILKNILMPHHFRSLTIHRVPDGQTEEAVRSFMSRFGTIEDFYKANVPAQRKVSPKGFWGKVTFLDNKKAASALATLKENDDGYQVSSSLPTNDKRQDRIQVKISWCRRRLRGFGFAVFADPSEAAIGAARVRSLVLEGSIVSVSLNKKNESEMYLNRIPGSCTQEQVMQALNDDGIHPTQLRLIRESGKTTSNQDLEMYKRQISRQLDEVTVPDTYEIKLLKPRNDKDFYLDGFITFTNMENALDVVQTKILITGEGNPIPVNMEPRLEFCEFVSKEVYELVRVPMKIALDNLTGPSVKINKQILSNGCFRIRVTTSSLAELQMCRDSIDEVIAATKISVEDPDHCHLLASANGRHFIQALRKEHHIHLQYDRWRSVLLLYGPDQNKTAASAEIQRFLLDSDRYQVREVSLTGQGKPAGVLRELFVRYKVDLEAFRETCGLFHVEVNVRNHTIKVQGTNAAIDEAVTCLTDIMTELSGNARMSEPDEDDCPVCLCEPDKNTYKTEYCGHMYCKDCIDGLVHHAITSKELPLQCTKDGCGKSLVIQDIYNLLGKSRDNLNALASATTHVFLLKNQARYRNCITPDCPIVYKRSSKKRLFECPNSTCQVRICTSCDEKYHDGLSCNIYQGQKEDSDYSLKAYMKQSRETRAFCPKCGAAIEKNGGCMHMKCRCGAHICWRCKRTFSTSNETYNHLGGCGGIFDADAH